MKSAFSESACIDLEKKRCSRCILPDDYPGIQFDEEGVCSVCREYDRNWAEWRKRGERRAREELVTPEELARAKKQKAAERVFELQTAEAQSANTAMDILSTSDANFSRQYVRRIQETTA
ncbi:MAG TPA: hypothetical protein P5266_06615, partial [Candidatus Fermentibacter sp.]|nr:hypothetical protein [Candidatus Fermentibacter sp.]